MKFDLKKLFSILAITIILISGFSLSALKSKRQPSNRNKWIFPHTTKLDHYGSGSIFYLDRHHIKVGEGKVLRGFHLWRPNPSSAEFAFEFADAEGRSITKQTYYKTTPQSDISSSGETVSIESLGKHYIKCNDNDMLNGFGLRRSGMQIYFAYSCVKVNGAQCNENTLSQDEVRVPDDGKIFFWDRAPLLLPEGYGINAFRFRPEIKVNKKKSPPETRRYWTYDYKFCKIPA